MCVCVAPKTDVQLRNIIVNEINKCGNALMGLISWCTVKYQQTVQQLIILDWLLAELRSSHASVYPTGRPKLRHAQITGIYKQMPSASVIKLDLFL